MTSRQKDPPMSFTRKELQIMAGRFALNDVCAIPKNMVTMEREIIGDTVEATVVGIYPNHIVFQLPNGMKRSYTNFDCRSIDVIKPSGFNVRGKRQRAADFTKAVKKIQTGGDE